MVYSFSFYSKVMCLTKNVEVKPYVAERYHQFLCDDAIPDSSDLSEARQQIQDQVDRNNMTHPLIAQVKQAKLIAEAKEAIDRLSEHLNLAEDNATSKRIEIYLEYVTKKIHEFRREVTDEPCQGS